MIRKRARRRRFQRGVIIIPSTFTLGNVFFGVFAMVMASRGAYEWAAWFIVFAGILDTFDGGLARFTRTGSRFGAELDSLADAVSFGVAPAMVMYQLYWADGSWSWLLSYLFVTAVVVRLARFNVEQGGEAKRSFHGLPSPAAGMMLATSYPFTQTAFFEAYLSTLPWAQVMGILMVLLSALMLSHVPYARMPRVGLRTPRTRINSAIVVATIVTAIAAPRYYFFPALFGYAVWGLLKAVAIGFLDRLPERDPLLEMDEDEDGDEPGDDEEARPLDYGGLGPRYRARRRNRLVRRRRTTPPDDNGTEEST